jgi:Family of unknown function (DUF5317)
VVLALPVLAAVVLGLLLGGSLRSLSELRLRGVGLLYAAVALQVVAFPFPFLPWRTPETAGKVLWLASYALVLAATILNRRVTGVPVVALGMASNLVAVIANRGLMPVLPGSLRAAGHDYHVSNNSIADARPHLAALVDRWAAPDWVPLANVYSVGDVVIAAGAALLVLSAMGVRLPLPPSRGAAHP